MYVIGYPQFIANSNSPCFGNAGFANKSERVLMNEATHYMNLVIRSAAQAAGVQYIDIENSLEGGELCQGIFTDYVTGVRNEWWIQGLGQDSLNEYLYHPNARGHEQMAKIIYKKIGKDFLYGNNAQVNPSIQPPDYTDYFSNTNKSLIFPIKSLDNTVLKQGQQASSESLPYLYKGNSKVTVTLHSSPWILGEFTTGNSGELSFNFKIPDNFPVGYHTIVFDGQSLSGENLEYVENIFVAGRTSNDVDADGIDDSIDKCLFVSPSGSDIDKDGIDDSCDDTISQVSNNTDSTVENTVTKDEFRQEGVVKNRQIMTGSEKEGTSGNDSNNTQEVFKSKSSSVQYNFLTKRFKVIVILVSASSLICVIVLSTYCFMRLRGK